MFTYVAVPYTDPNPRVTERRVEEFWKVCGMLIAEGNHVVSPMTLMPALAHAPTVPTTWDYWQGYSEGLMGLCGRVVVCKFEGWENSSGVRGEIAYAVDLGIPVEYLEWEVVL